MADCVADLIEAWFADHDDGEFVCGIASHPYSVLGQGNEGCVIFTAKPHIVSRVIEESEAGGELGMIGRCGLPSREDLGWISRVVGRRRLLFLGDMDPVDLMVFAWLRALLHPKPVTHIGVNDSFLEKREAPSIRIFSMPCAPSEQQSLGLLKKVLPDLGEIVGRNCASMLDQGIKIELDGFEGGQMMKALIVQCRRPA